jgi:transcriptional regulator with PAS, ATPase and Fis domain
MTFTSEIKNEFIGESAPMRELMRFIGKAARVNSTVLIQGESGTGKELVARALFRNSPRCEGPFVAVNCAALTESLLESELFGYEKGAFTGADRQKIGKFELANGGTVFLDEVGELGPSIQAKLLRALQEREVDRIGGTRPVPIDVRFIAATNRDLECAVAAGRFREDLYYRLKVLSVTTPALRDRREDIPALVRYFLFKYARVADRVVLGISAETDEIFRKYDWPGNVRQLENVIEYALVLGSTEYILPADLPLEIVGGKRRTYTARRN